MHLSFKVGLNLLAVLLIFLAISSSAIAAPPEGRGNKPKPGDGGGGRTTYGLDVSWPQCGKDLPKDMAFTIVGVNDGLANTTNTCLEDQLAWASQAPGTENQPGLQLYVNTANPAGLGTQSWPTSNIDPSNDAIISKYGQCQGVFNYDLACSYQYGWNRAVEDDVQRFSPAATTVGIDNNSSNYTWWLDIETMNTWLSPTSDFNFQSNVAVIEGMSDYFHKIGAKVGLYSTAYQWGEITNNQIPANSTLNGLPNWRPSGRSLENAQANCGVDPLTNNGIISITQYIRKNLDYNYSCIK